MDTSNFVDAVTSNTITRPEGITTYAAGDLVANSTTAASVTPFTFVSSTQRPHGGIFRVGRVRLQKSTTSTTNASFRVHLYAAAPGTPSNGDNGAWVTPIADYIGPLDVTIDKAFTNGAQGAGVPQIGSEIVGRISAGTTLYALLEARAAYTPGSAETFTIIIELYRF